MDIPIDSEGRRLHIPNRYVVWGAGVLAVLATVLSAVYTVEPEENALVLRFGRHVGTSGPGLHWRLPLGIDRLVKVPVETVDVEEFGYRTHRPAKGGESGGEFTRSAPAKQVKGEAIMLTGDLNIVFVGWDVQYQRSDPEDFTFHVQEPLATLRDVAQTVMRDIVGDRASLYILTEERGEIQEEVRMRVQERCTSYRMGLRVQLVNLLFADPPAQVKDSFHDLNRAVQDATRFFQEASREYEEHVPKAQGQKRRVILEAEGYRTQRVEEARGAALYFGQVLEEYAKYPQVTWIRLYVETIREVMPQLERVFVVEGADGSVIPLLDLMRPTQEGN